MNTRSDMSTLSHPTASVADDARNTSQVLAAMIDVVGWDDALGRIASWAQRRESRYVCICNVHSVVTAQDNRAFLSVVNGADMATPDGAPIAWSLRTSGFRDQQRINGPDLMWKQLREAEREGMVVSFYGASPDTLDLLRATMWEQFSPSEDRRDDLSALW